MNNRIRKTFNQINSSDRDSEVAMDILLQLLEKTGKRFSDFFVFRQDIATSGEPNLSPLERKEILDLQVAVLTLKQETQKTQNLFLKRRQYMEVLAAKESRAFQTESDLIDTYNEARKEFSFFSRPKGFKKRKKSTLSLTKDQSEYSEVISFQISSLDSEKNLGDKNPKWKELVALFDNGDDTSKKAMLSFKALLRNTGLKFSHVLKHKDEISDPQKTIEALNSLDYEGKLLTRKRELVEKLCIRSEAIVATRSIANKKLGIGIKELIDHLDKKSPLQAEKHRTKIVPPQDKQKQVKKPVRKKVAVCAFLLCACALMAVAGGNKTGKIDQNSGHSTPTAPSSSQKEELKTFYISYDQVSLWSTIKNGKGQSRIENLHLGDKTYVKMPVNHNKLPKNMWIYVKTTAGLKGYVLSRQLSAKRPQRQSSLNTTSFPYG